MTSNPSIKLDVGCGGRGSMYPEFIGIDIHPIPPAPRSVADYLKMDFLTEELPMNWIGGCDEVVCFHLIEHLTPDDGRILLNRIYACLSPHASAYISCPDLKLFCKKYLEKDNEFFGKCSGTNNKPLWPGETLADKMNYQMHQNDHRWAYDVESLTWRAEEAGVDPNEISPLPLDHFWCRRPDHECGIIITKGVWS